MGEVNSGFTPENIADAEWLWSNINADHRRFHDLPTHHKAMICHTAQRFRADRIGFLTERADALALQADEWEGKYSIVSARITHQEAVIAGLVKALEWVEYCDGLGTFRKRDGREVVVSFEDSDEGMKFFETISDFTDNARAALAKAKESRDA